MGEPTDIRCQLIQQFVQIILELHYGVAVELTGEVPEIASQGSIITSGFKFQFRIEGEDTAKHEITGQVTIAFADHALEWSPVLRDEDLWTVDGATVLDFSPAPSKNHMERFYVVNRIGVTVCGSSLDDVMPR